MIVLMTLALAEPPSLGGRNCIAIPVPVVPSGSMQEITLSTGDPLVATFWSEAYLPAGYEPVAVTDLRVVGTQAFTVLAACRQLSAEEARVLDALERESRCRSWKTSRDRWVKMGWPESDLPPRPQGCE